MNDSPQEAGHPYHSEDMNPNHFDQDDADDDGFSGRPSKSALKRESHELQELGKQLLEMPDSLFELSILFSQLLHFLGTVFAGKIF